MTLAVPGTRNLITDVAGLRVGHASDESLKSGTTVLTGEKPFAASVDIRGGAPGTRETDLLAPDKLVDAIDAIVLAGGSAFGLDAASGVMDALHAAGRGFEVGSVRVPLVPAAIIFDLLNGGNKNWHSNPYRDLGRTALQCASAQFDLGTCGAGTGATTADLKGGVGSASVVMPDGSTVGALVVVNARGSVVTPGTGHFWAAPFELNEEFGAFGVCQTLPAMHLNTTGLSDDSGANTTIAVVATDVPLSCSQLKRLATVSHDGMARAIVPSHTLFDGDLVFAVSTGNAAEGLSISPANEAALGHAAALCLSRAIARGVFEATATDSDLLPCWSNLFSDHR